MSDGVKKVFSPDRRRTKSYVTCVIVTIGLDGPVNDLLHLKKCIVTLTLVLPLPALLAYAYVTHCIYVRVSSISSCRDFMSFHENLSTHVTTYKYIDWGTSVQ